MNVQETGTPDRDERLFTVVMNGEEQYSVWPAESQPPLGWNVIKPAATRKECLEYIATTWTDITPRSVRENQSRGSSGGA